MSNYSITVDTGASSRRYSDAELLSFYRNTGIMQAALESMKGSVRGLRSGFQGAARCLSRMGFAVRGVLSGLMDTRNVVDGLRAGMKNLYAYSKTWWKSFAGTLQSLSANAVYLRNSLAAMAAPLMNALAPAIEYVTDRLVGLFNLLNQFFARLTGASTYVAAKRAAGGVGAVGRAAANASGEVKELKRQLADFDDLNVLSAVESGGGSGSGGSGSSGGAGMAFEEREIEGGLAAFVDALKAAFNAGDWQALGTLIGDRINALVDSVDWAAVGAKVGYYVNGLFSTAYWTLETTNFTNIGARVAELLNNALAEIDFKTVGGTVALLFTSLAETVAGFVDEFDWVQFAEKLAEGVNGFALKLGEKLDAIDWAGLALRLTEGLNAFIARTDWAGVGDTLGGRFNDLLAILGSASANFDWKGAGEALAAGVNGMVRRVDWAAIGQWLNDTLLGVVDFGIAFFEGFDAKAFADGLEKALAKVDWDAISQKLLTLFQAALKKLGEAFGALLFGGSADVKLNLGLLRDGWETLAKWLGIDKPLSALVGLLRDNWQTIAKWLGIESPVSVGVALVRSGWKSISDFVGTVASVAAKLLPNPASGSSTLAGVFGSFFNVLSNLTGKTGDSKTLTGVYGDSFNTRSSLKGATGDSKKLTDVYGDSFITRSDLKGKTGDSKTLTDVYGTDFNTRSDLKGATKDSKTLTGVYGDSFNTRSDLKGATKDSKSLTDVFGSSFDVKASLDSGSSQRLKSAATKALKGIKVTVKAKSDSGGAKLETKEKGGAITRSGRSIAFARGGILSGGMARYLGNVPHYAGGTTRAHGTVFVAGEAGPEIMGHINGRTEILNRSQLAQTMYSAVLSAMGTAVSALGTFLSGQLANCTNAIVATIGNREQGTGNRNGRRFAGLEYHAPVMASGTVMPYDVAAQIARTGMDIQNTLDANNEDLIQTIISVAGQIVAAVQSQGNREQGTGNRNSQGLTAQQLIDDINRRAQMFGSSPILN